MGLVTTAFRGLLRVFEEVAERVEQEVDNEDAIKAELTELYSKLEDGTISEQEFAEREAELVERLDELETRKQQQEDQDDVR